MPAGPGASSRSPSGRCSIAPLPDEHWVIIGYPHDPRRPSDELRFDWRVFVPAASEAEEPTDPVPTAAALGVDLEGRAVQRSPSARCSPDPAATRRRRSVAREITSTSDALAASVIDSPTRQARLPPDLELLGARPRRVRLGGQARARAAARPRSDHRRPEQPRRSDLGRGANAAAPHAVADRSRPGSRSRSPSSPATWPTTTSPAPIWCPWQPSIEEAVGTGEVYSQPVPLTDRPAHQRPRPVLRRPGRVHRGCPHLFVGRPVLGRLRRQRDRPADHGRCGHGRRRRQRLDLRARCSPGCARPSLLPDSASRTGARSRSRSGEPPAPAAARADRSRTSAWRARSSTR